MRCLYCGVSKILPGQRPAGLYVMQHGDPAGASDGCRTRSDNDPDNIERLLAIALLTIRASMRIEQGSAFRQRQLTGPSASLCRS